MDIIVRLDSVAHRDLIWKNRFLLKGSKLVLSEDFSQGTEERRQKMQPYFRAAKKHPDVKKCFLNRDVLSINGYPYTVHNLDALPYGLADFNPSQRPLKDGGIAFFGKNSFLSNFHPSPISDSGLLFPMVEHLFQYKKAVFFQDIPTSKQILLARTPNKVKALSHNIRRCG